MAETVILLLCIFALVTTTQGQSCSKPVGGQNMFVKGEDINKNTFPDQARVSFACSSGYEPSGGSPYVTCNAGSWSQLTLTCQRKSCGSLGDVDNGHVEYPQGVEFGDKAVISCNPGYTLVGKREIYCMAQGWEGRVPTCDAVECVTPPDVEKATFTPDKESYKYGEVVTYKCSPELKLNGSQKLTCSDGGEYDNPPPTCVVVNCEDPIKGFLEFVDGSRPPYGLQSSIKVTCSQGYTLVGLSSLTCTIESKWSPEIPTCQKITRPTTTTTTTTTISPTTEDSSGDGRSVGIAVGISTVVLLVAASSIIFIIYRKRSAQRKNTDKEAAKDGENVRLS